MATDARVVVSPPGTTQLEIQEVRLPDPGPHEVLVEQFASGVCHSQLHNIFAERDRPWILGHESTGTVLAVGAEVSHVAEGDRVFVTWVPRDAARASRSPRPSRITLGDGTVPVCRNVFTWADRTLADEQFVVKAPPDMATDVTAIIGCAVMTGAGAVVNTAQVRPGDSVAIFGVGGVGLSAISAAKVAGADPLIAVDLDDEKLAFARRFGATHTVNASRTDAVAAVRELTTRPDRWDFNRRPVAGADFAFDCIGVPATRQQIAKAARSGAFGREPGGCAVLVGVPTVNPDFDYGSLLLNETRYIGSIGGSCVPERDFPRFLGWYAEGQLRLDELVTARYRLDDINAAVDDLHHGRIAGRAILDLTT